MNSKYAALAMSVFAMGAVALTSTEASAMVKDPGPGSTVEPYGWPDEGAGYPGSETKSPEYSYPNYDPKYEVPRVAAAMDQGPSDDNGREVLQAGVSALGGAGVAFGGMWLYRRRHVLAS